MRYQHIPTGETIVEQDARGDSLFIIVEGVVAVKIHGESDTMIEDRS